MDTVGSIVDKLATVNQKLYLSQDLLYEVRRMTEAQFVERFYTPDGIVELWTALKKCCDLNLQRNALIDELDELIVAMIRRGGDLDDGKHVQRKYKSY